MNQNIYIAFTPYHIFLASMIALEYRQEQNILIIVADFEADHITASLQHSDLFSSCIMLPGLYKLETRRNSLRRRNANKINQLISSYKTIARLFMGTDTRLETQAAAYATRKLYTDALIAVMEDGGDFYNSSDEGYSPKNFWRQLYSKFTLGRWYEDVKISGFYSLTEELHVIYPELVRKDLQAKKRLGISGHHCFEEPYQNFLRLYWEKFSQERSHLLQIDIILMVAYSGYATQFPAYIPLIRKICEAAANANLRIAVKYHPREETPDYCNLSTIKDIVFLPAQIPAEIIYADKGLNLKFIIGDISSSLMTAKWLLKERISVYSVAPILGITDDSLLNAFQQAGIILAADWTSIRLFNV